MAVKVDISILDVVQNHMGTLYDVLEQYDMY